MNYAGKFAKTYNATKAAERLGCHTNTVRRWIRLGLLPATKDPDTNQFVISGKDLKATARSTAQRNKELGNRWARS